MKRNDYSALGEELYTETLPNGLPIYVMKKKGFRKSFAAFAVNYGGADRRFMLDGRMHDTPAGVAHYLEHKMFDMPDGNALARLEANGASPNAFTSDAMTFYHFECTSSFDENLRELLRFVSTPWFTEESVAKEQGIIGQEIRMCEDSPDFRLYINLMRSLFDHSPLRDGVAGTVESIAEINPEVLYNCHKAFYRPGNMALAVVGDVDPETVAETAAAMLPGEKLEKPQVDYGGAETPEPLAGCIQESMEVSMPQFVAGLKIGPSPYGIEALRERLVASLTLKCLFGRSSEFYNRLYSEGLLDTEFSTEAEYAAGEGAVMFGGQSRDPDAVMAQLCAEIARKTESGLDEDYFRRQKKSGYGSRIRALADFDGLAVSMIEGCFNGYQPLDSFELVEKITAEDCISWAKKNLVPQRMALSVIRPKE